MSKRLFDTYDGHTVYKVPLTKGPINGIVEVPGSKSITNRALLLAALADGTTTLTGVLFSDDSRHFLDSLLALGFKVQMDEGTKTVNVTGLGGKIPSKQGTIHVGSAGTAARFLTAMLALSEGSYTILCSDQMKKRPMKPLFDVLKDLGATFEYLEAPDHLPVKVTGNGGQCRPIELDITRSTQFLSALLMLGPLLKKDLSILITSPKTDGAYIRITRTMVEAFGGQVHYDGKTYTLPAGYAFKAQSYAIEPDMSAACYFYAIAALTGGSILVKGVHPDISQGDIKFLNVLEDLGCKLIDTPKGIQVEGPPNGEFDGIEVNLNDFSDQTMTLAVLAAYAKSRTVIEGVAHIKLQECDRMTGIVNELTRVGIRCHADEDNIYITPGPIHKGLIQTYDDHRFAMAFSLLGLKTKGILIDDPMCCRKTFENYFEVLNALLEINSRSSKDL